MYTVYKQEIKVRHTQTEEEEHGGMLSVAEVGEVSAASSCNHLAQKPDEGEEHLEEAFPLPATQPSRTTAAEVHRERHARRERSGARLAAGATREVTTKHLHCPPEREDHEKRARQSVAAESSHRHGRCQYCSPTDRNPTPKTGQYNVTQSETGRKLLLPVYYRRVTAAINV